MSTRWGMTVPLGGVPLAEHAAVFAALTDAGFTDLWSSEVAGTDAFTPLTLAAAWQPRARLGTAITPVFTRGPALLAMTAAALAEAAPGRFQLGIGASSPVVVGDWNAADFTSPFARSRDMLEFLRAALAGEMVDREFETFRVRRFRLERPPATPPGVLLAALRPGMLRLAASAADGVILNWLAATDVPRALAEAKSDRPGFDVVARIFVCPTKDAAYARTVGRRMIAAYLTVPAYAEFHRWLGREPVLAPMWTAWAAGDRKGALAAIPDEVVDELIVHGSPEQCREHVARYAEAGVDVPVMALVPTPELQQGGAAALGELITGLGRP
ncbi:LLM class F420-dependent oxidoreductase [Actinoplanes auranticolor]|uniref:LLM class F420-dependent oxidoreductase n=1 Tax=Actinoplanes auranticolor TaxID=47988 RepID=A0A919SGA9_9ACTN|nr:LLM class F420-dependent oxidoreductase [Actinoplanes auranticolor]GIM71134.1 LLM class F420-dependent oxidoreductase [Actinoplanes auranticolor]